MPGILEGETRLLQACRENFTPAAPSHAPVQPARRSAGRPAAQLKAAARLAGITGHGGTDAFKRPGQSCGQKLGSGRGTQCKQRENQYIFNNILAFGLFDQLQKSHAQLHQQCVHGLTPPDVILPRTDGVAKALQFAFQSRLASMPFKFIELLQLPCHNQGSSCKRMYTTSMGRPRSVYRLRGSETVKKQPITAFSIQLFTESWMPSGFFLKKKPLGTPPLMSTCESKTL